MVQTFSLYLVLTVIVLFAAAGGAQPVDPYQSGDRPLSWEMYRQRQVEMQVEMQRQQLEIRRQQLRIQEGQLEIERQQLEIERQRQQIEREKQAIEREKQNRTQPAP